MTNESSPRVQHPQIDISLLLLVISIDPTDVINKGIKGCMNFVINNDGVADPFDRKVSVQ